MFKINKLDLTAEEKKRYFLNHQQISKDFLKVIKLISHREKVLNENYKKLKYNHIIHIIKKSLYNKEINFSSLEYMANNLINYIKEHIDLNDCVYTEIISLLFFYIENKNKKNLKQSLMKKINLRIGKINEVTKKDIYSNKKRNKKDKIEIDDLRKYITELDYQELNTELYHFNEIFNYYKEFINKRYTYVLKPEAFVESYYVFKIDFMKKYESFFNYAKINQSFLDLKQLLIELVYIMNIRFLNQDYIPENSFYIQTDEERYIEIEMIEYELSASYHGGKKFAHLIIGNSPVYHLKRKEMEMIYKDEMILQKIVWRDLLNLELKFYGVNVFLVLAKEGIFFVKDDDEYEKILYKYEIKNFAESVLSYAIFNKTKVDANRLKGFFLYKLINDNFEIVLYNNFEEELLKVNLYIDRVEIVELKKKEIVDYKSIIK